MPDLDLTISKTVLLPLLARAAECSAAKSPMPILNCVILSTRDKALSLLATDTIVGISCEAEAAIKKPGRCAVDARRLYASAKDLPFGDVRFVLRDKRLEVSAGKSRFSLSVLDPDDFPSLPTSDGATAFVTLPARSLATALVKGAYAARTGEDVPALAGALLDADKSAFTVISTDGNRMAAAVLDHAADKERVAAIPSRCVSELRRLCEMIGEADVALSATPADLFASHDGVTLSMKTNEPAQLASWRKLKANADDQLEHRVRIDRELFIAAVKRVAAAVVVFSGVKLEFADGACRISAENSESDGSDEVVCDAGKAFRIGLNAGYLLAALAALDDDEVTFSAGGELSAAIVSGAGKSWGLVMPVRLG